MLGIFTLFEIISFKVSPLSIVKVLFVPIGFGLTTIVLLAKVVPHEPPLDVRVKVAVPLYPPGGVQIAFKFVALGANVPPVGEDHVPPVAPPPTEPPKTAELLP